MIMVSENDIADDWTKARPLLGMKWVQKLTPWVHDIVFVSGVYHEQMEEKHNIISTEHEMVMNISLLNMKWI